MDTVPNHLREAIKIFLGEQDILEDVDLFSALSSPDGRGPPLLLERARDELSSGAYMIIRSACNSAGGLPPQPDQRAPQAMHEPSATVPPAQAAPSDLPDFLRMRQLLDSAAFGEPLKAALPLRTQLDECDAAARDQGPPRCSPCGRISGTRLLPKTICEMVQKSWAEMLTGRAVPADVLNVLYAMGQVAQDERFPTNVAEAAAVRYASTVRHQAYLEAMGQRTGPAAIQTWSKTLQTEHPYLAERLCQEEQLAQQSGNVAAGNGGQPRRANGVDGADTQYCLLWAIDECRRGEACNFHHACPFNPSHTQPGCFLRRGEHLQTFQRPRVRAAVMGNNNQPSNDQRNRQRFQNGGQTNRPPQQDNRRSRSPARIGGQVQPPNSTERR